jgi:hypothetical protein
MKNPNVKGTERKKCSTTPKLKMVPILVEIKNPITLSSIGKIAMKKMYSITFKTL